MVDEYVLKIVQTALVNATSLNYPTSNLLKDVQRIATHRRDFENLWWILLELRCGRKEDMQEIDNEMKSKFSDSEFRTLRVAHFEKWMSERFLNKLDAAGNIEEKDQVFPFSIYDIEDRLHTIEHHTNSLTNTNGMHSLDVYYIEKENSSLKIYINLQREQFQNIINRIRNRVTDYLVDTEMQLLQGNTLSHYFEKNREWVETMLFSLDSHFEGYFKALKNHVDNGTDIDYEEALLDIRKILCLYANCICPPHKDSVLCFDGKQRVLTEDKYLNRISFVLFEKGRKHTYTEMLNQNAEDLVKRIEKVNQLACKGVHSNISEMEANQCVIQMYLVLGDLIRIVRGLKDTDDAGSYDKNFGRG